MAGPDNEKDHGLIPARSPTPGDAGGGPAWIFQERGWLALIIASTAAVLLVSVYCLSHGIATIFMPLFYFPIVLMACRYRYRGLVPAMLLSLAYVALVYLYNPGQSGIITGAWYHFLVFVGIAALVAYLSGQLVSGTTALEERERNLKLHADFTSDCEFWIDMDGNYRYITPSCKPVTGYDPDEFYADPETMLRLIHPDDRAVFREHQKTYVTSKDPATLRFRIVRKDGQVRWIEHVCQAMYGPGGDLIGRRGSNRDITERTGFEERLRLQNQIFETIAEGINLVRTGDGVIVYTNSRFDRMSGYEKGELAGRHVSVVNAPGETMSPEDVADTIMKALLENGEWRGELKNLRKDGSTFWSLVVISSFRHPEFGPVWISAHTDITARKLAEEAVNAAVSLNSRIDTMSVAECMSYTLDEAERLTSSRIGFFHFVNEGEKTIELVAWSTETKKHCFIPKEPERHYPVEKGGVWLDCMRERKPVIHNDYASLPNKKGLPEGHVPVTRELVVPIFDADRIVAIIGVGNKASEYDDRDTRILTLLAKNTWTLVRRKRAEEELLSSRETYRELVENLNDVIISLDMEGKFTYVSPAFERLYGFIPHDMIGQHFPDIIHPDDRLPATESFKKMLAGEYGISDFRVIAKDGRVEHVIISPHPIIRDGAVTGFNYILTTITARKLAEESVRKSFAILKGVVESPKNVVIFALDSQYRYTAFNENHRRTMKQIWGADIALGKSMLEYIRTPGDRNKALLNFNRALSGESFTLVEAYGDTAFERRWYEDIYNPVRDENGYVIGLTLFLTDITGRKAAEEALQESERKFREIFNNINDAIELHEMRDDGLPGKYLEVNDVTCRMLGYTREELLQHSPLDFATEYHDRPVEEIGKEIITRGHSRFETGHRSRDGTVIPVEINAHVLRHDDRTLVLSVVRDITERKKAEEALLESRQILEAVLNSIPGRVFWKDKNLVYLGCNTAFARDAGFEKPEDIIGKDDYAMGWHEQAEIYRSDDRTVIASGIPKILFEEPQTTPTGEKIHLLTSKVPLRNAGGEIIGVLGTYLDITDRKRAEEALRASMEQFRTVFDQTYHLMGVLDPQGTLLEINTVAAEYLRAEHIDPASVLKKPFWLTPWWVHDPVQQKTLEDAIPRAVSGEMVRFEATHPSGTGLITVDFSLKPVRDAGGNTVLLIAEGWDITERKTAAQHLDRQYRFLQQLIDTIPNPVFYKDRNGVYTGCNIAFERYIGLSRDQVIGKSAYDIAPKDLADIYTAADRKLLDNPGTQVYESRVKYADGTLHDVIFNKATFTGLLGDVDGLVGVLLDITERKKAEDEVQKSGLEWQTTFNAITDAVFLLDDKGRIIRHNRAFELYSGKPADEIDGSSCFEVMHDTAYPIEGCPFEKAKKSRQRESFELKVGNRWFVAAVDPVFSRGGEITGGVHLLIDVTERRLAENALRESEERFRTLSETSLTGIYIFLDGLIRYVNPTFAKMFGYTPEEMIGMDPMTLVHPDDRALVRQKMQGRLDHLEGVSVYESRMVTRDGRTIQVSIMGAVIPYQGRPAISGNLLDITERKRAEEALRESEERYRILFDESPISLWEEDLSDIRYWMDTKKEEGVWDFQAYFEAHTDDVLSCVRMVNVTRINHASMALFGAHSLHEFSGGLSSVFTPESYDSFRDEMVAISQGKTSYESEIPLQTLSGEKKIALLKMIIVPGFEQTLEKVVISLLDITERKKMEDALRQANRKITMLSSITRHDIKNQLLTLRGFLGLSQMKATDPELLTFMKKEERAAEAISSQIEFTKFYEDIGVKAPEWQDIAELIQTARSQLPLPETVRFAVTVPPVKVFADSLIEKVFYNLMENTLRHGEHVSLIRFSFSETARGAEIVYEDDGVGISISDKQHLFEKGFGKNTGLGLFLSREILAITGLTIREEGGPGKGVRFVIGVPKEGYRIRKDL